MDENENSVPGGSRGHFGGGTLILPTDFDLILRSERVDELTYDNRQLLKHDNWTQDYVPRLVEDARLLPVEGGLRAFHDPVVIPHHRPGIQVSRHVLPTDGGPVHREGTCWRCWEAFLVLHHGLPLDLPVRPLFVLWVRGGDDTIVEIGMCRECAAGLLQLAPKWKAIPRAAV